ENETKQTAQTSRTRRTVSRDPNRIGNHHRIRAQIFSGFRNDRLEVWRTDLFLKFPQETNVDRNARLDRRTRAKQRRQSGALVVSRAAAEIGVAVLCEDKRFSVPRLRLLRSGLNVDVVVNSHGRTAAVVTKNALHHRVATIGTIDLGLAAKSFESFHG